MGAARVVPARDRESCTVVGPPSARGERHGQGLLDRARRRRRRRGLQGLRRRQRGAARDASARRFIVRAGRFENPEGAQPLAQRRRRVPVVPGRARLLEVGRLPGRGAAAPAGLDGRHGRHRGLRRPAARGRPAARPAGRSWLIAAAFLADRTCDTRHVSQTPCSTSTARWCAAASGRTLPVVNPATGEQIGTVAHAETADLDRALEAAEQGLQGLAQGLGVRALARSCARPPNLLRERADAIAPLHDAWSRASRWPKRRRRSLAGADVIDWFAEEGAPRLRPRHPGARRGRLPARGQGAGRPGRGVHAVEFPDQPGRCASSRPRWPPAARSSSRRRRRRRPRRPN